MLKLNLFGKKRKTDLNPAYSKTTTYDFNKTKMFDSLNYNIDCCAYEDRLTLELWINSYCDSTRECLNAFKQEDWDKLFQELPAKSLIWKKRFIDCLIGTTEPNQLKALISLADTDDEELFVQIIMNLFDFDYCDTEGIEKVHDKAAKMSPAANDYQKSVLNPFIEKYRRKEISGLFGDEISWILDETGMLTISGNGQIVPSKHGYKYPWEPHRDTITKVIIQSGVINIGDNMFSKCINLNSIEVPDGITSIGEYAFFHCSNLRIIMLPDGLTSIEGSAFADCKSLERIEIPEGVMSIGRRAFADCSNLESIELPESLALIKREAFSGCKNLKKITLPSSVKRIGFLAFQNCKDLYSVERPKTVFIPLEKGIFFGCDNLDLTTIIDPMDTVQSSMEDLNKELDDFIYRNLDGCNSVYYFWFEEVASPDEADIEEQINDPDQYSVDVEEAVRQGIWKGTGSDEWTDDIKSIIMRTLNRHPAILYELFPQGWEKYECDPRYQDYFLVCIHGEKDHWYIFYTSWSS